MTHDDVMEQIARRRARIDELDERIVALLDERAAESIAVRPLKERAGMGLFDAGREEQIFERVAALGNGPLRAQDLRAIYETLLEVMKQVPAQEDRSGSEGNEA